MPRFIGKGIDGMVYDLPDNFIGNNKFCQLTYSQAHLMLSGTIHVSLDTTDKGSAGVMAKRWWRFFALRVDVIANADSTHNMQERAKK